MMHRKIVLALEPGTYRSRPSPWPAKLGARLEGKKGLDEALPLVVVRTGGPVDEVDGGGGVPAVPHLDDGAAHQGGTRQPQP